MKYLYTIFCLAYFGLIGFAIWYTSSAYCLWALILAPSILSNGRHEFIKIELKNKG